MQIYYPSGCYTANLIDTRTFCYLSILSIKAAPKEGDKVAELFEKYSSAADGGIGPEGKLAGNELHLAAQKSSLSKLSMQG